MALIIDASYKAFDTAQIQRGDCVRIRRTGSALSEPPGGSGTAVPS